MTEQALAVSISLNQWVPVLQRWFLLRHAVVVGQGSLAMRQLNAQPNRMSHFKAGDNTRNGRPDSLLIAERSGPVNFYQNSLPAESGLLAADALKGCWPSIKSMGQHLVDALSLDEAAEQNQLLKGPEQGPNWVWLGCLPGAPLLRGAPRLLAQADVVAVRVVLSPNGPTESSLAAAEHLLGGQGFVLCGVEPERNPQLGTALFVKDYSAAHAQALRQTQSLNQALQAQTKAKEAETAAKLVEARGRAAEQQAKEQALAKAKALEDDKAQLTDAKDKALAQLQQLAEHQQVSLEQLAQAKAAIEAQLIQEIQVLKQLQVQRAQDIAQVMQARDEQAQLAHDRAHRVQDLEQQIQSRQADEAELLARQQMMNEEMLRAEIQIDLIKDILLREPRL
jgi:hypothetical protein